MLSLKAGIEDLKQAKTLMSEANHIMSDHISKLKALEEENAELRAELDDWKGNAEGFQPDAYMKLPLDADGEPIRIGDVVWYIGDDAEITKCEPQKVVGLVSVFGMLGTYVMTRDYPDKALDPKSLAHKKPEPPDSWEKLEEDAKKTICKIAGQKAFPSCGECKWVGKECNRMARLEILKRAKKLAGIEGEGVQR